MQRRQCMPLSRNLYIRDPRGLTTTGRMHPNIQAKHSIPIHTPDTIQLRWLVVRSRTPMHLRKRITRPSTAVGGFIGSNHIKDHLSPKAWVLLDTFSQAPLNLLRVQKWGPKQRRILHIIGIGRSRRVHSP